MPPAAPHCITASTGYNPVYIQEITERRPLDAGCCFVLLFFSRQRRLTTVVFFHTPLLPSKANRQTRQQATAFDTYFQQATIPTFSRQTLLFSLKTYPLSPGRNTHYPQANVYRRQ